MRKIIISILDLFSAGQISKHIQNVKDYKIIADVILLSLKYDVEIIGYIKDNVTDSDGNVTPIYVRLQPFYNHLNKIRPKSIEHNKNWVKRTVERIDEYEKIIDYTEEHFQEVPYIKQHTLERIQRNREEVINKML